MLQTFFLRAYCDNRNGSLLAVKITKGYRETCAFRIVLWPFRHFVSSESRSQRLWKHTPRHILLVINEWSSTSNHTIFHSKQFLYEILWWKLSKIVRFYLIMKLKFEPDFGQALCDNISVYSTWGLLVSSLAACAVCSSGEFESLCSLPDNRYSVSVVSLNEDDLHNSKVFVYGTDQDFSRTRFYPSLHPLWLTFILDDLDN